MLRFEGNPMVRRTRERASSLWVIPLVLAFAIVVVGMLVVLTDWPREEPAVPAYVEELHRHMNAIEYRLENLEFRMLHLEILVGETYDLTAVVQHLLEGGEWLYYVEIALEKEGE